MPGAEDRALARGSVLGTTAPECPDPESSSSEQLVMHFTYSGKYVSLC